MNPDGVLARVGWSCLTTALRPVRRLKGATLVGESNLPPRAGGHIITCNHPALIDSFWLILLLRRRVAICGAKPKYFRTTARRTLLGIANIRRVEDRDEFMRTASQLLERQRTVLVYPEMGRSPDGLGPFEPWVAELALKTSSRLYPCWLDGTAPGKKGRPKLVVGASIEPEGSAEALLERLRQAMIALEARV